MAEIGILVGDGKYADPAETWRGWGRNWGTSLEAAPARTSLTLSIDEPVKLTAPLLITWRT